MAVYDLETLLNNYTTNEQVSSLEPEDIYRFELSDLADLMISLPESADWQLLFEDTEPIASRNANSRSVMALEGLSPGRYTLRVFHNFETDPSTDTDTPQADTLIDYTLDLSIVASDPDLSTTSEEENGDPAATDQTDPTDQTDGVTDTTERETSASPEFSGGYFIVGDSGEVVIDYILDRGNYQSQVGVFSLEGIEAEVGSEAWNREAIRRALTDTELGYTIIDDRQQDAWLDYQNAASSDVSNYQQSLQIKMQAGDRIALVVIPDGTLQEVVDKPPTTGKKAPLFSLATANPDDRFYFGQIAEAGAEVFVLEDQRVDLGSDRDYNDIGIRISGATPVGIVSLDDVIGDDDWRDEINWQTNVTPSVVAEVVSGEAKAGARWSVTGTATDANGAWDIAAIELLVLAESGAVIERVGIALDETETTSDTRSFETNFDLPTSLADGRYTLDVRVVDLHGEPYNSNVTTFEIGDPVSPPVTDEPGNGSGSGSDSGNSSGGDSGVGSNPGSGEDNTSPNTPEPIGNQPPEAENITATIGEDDDSITAAFRVKDANVGDQHRFSLITTPDQGELVNNNDGTFTFFPGEDFQDLAAGATRQLQIDYVAIDDSGASNDTSEPKTISITVRGQNDQPIILTPENTESGLDTLNDSGSVYELNDGDLDENQVVHSVSGTLSLYDPDASELPSIAVLTPSEAYLGTFEAELSNVGLGQIAIAEWRFSLSDAAIDHLSENETIQQTYTIEFTDSSGGITTQDVTIEIVGSNDTPIVNAIEIETTEDDTAITQSFTGFDPDTNDTRTFEITNPPTAGRVTNNNDGTFTFYPDSSFQSLGAADRRRIEFDYRALDNSGTSIATSDIATIGVTVLGKNDAAQILGEKRGTIFEDAAFPSTAQGQLRITDSDEGEAQFQALNKQRGRYGEFSINQEGLWNYLLTDERRYQTLDNNQSLQETFTVSAIDGTQSNVNITIIGKDEFFSQDNINKQVYEGSGSQKPRTSGNFFAGSFDRIKSLELIHESDGNIGDFTHKFSNFLIANNVRWSFEVDNSEIEYLSQGEIIAQNYVLQADVELRNLFGKTGSTTDTVTIQINIIGTNDTPTWGAGDTTGRVTELPAGSGNLLNPILSDSGLITFHDIDLNDTHSLTIRPKSSDFIGTLSANIIDTSTRDGNGQIAWEFKIGDNTLNNLKSGDQLTQTYEIQLQDNHGGIATQDITIELNGSDDPSIKLDERLDFISEDQSIWNTGDATVIDWSTFLGINEYKSFNTTIFNGLDIPDISFPGMQAVTAKFFGKTITLFPAIPGYTKVTPDIPKIILDGYADIKVGLEPYLKFTSGDIDSNLGIDLVLEIPETSQPGDVVTISTASLLSNESFFKTFSPNINFGLNFIFDVDADADIKAVPFHGGSSQTLLDLPRLDISKIFSLFEFSADDLEAELELSPFGLNVNFPVINTEGNVINDNTLIGEGSDDVLTATIDLDALPFAVKDIIQEIKDILPSKKNNDLDNTSNQNNAHHSDDNDGEFDLEGALENANFEADISLFESTIKTPPINIFGIDLGTISGDYTLFDLDLNGILDLEQKFVLNIDDIFGKLTFENGDVQEFKVGSDITFTVPEDFDPNQNSFLDATAAIDLEATLKHDLTFGLGASLDLEVMSAELGLDFPRWINTLGVADFSKSFGLLYEKSFPIANANNVGSLFSNQFDLEGFNQEIFQIGTGSGNSFDFWTQAYLWKETRSSDERSDFIPNAPTFVITHGFTSNSGNFENLASAIYSYAENVGKDVNVVLWDWSDQAGRLPIEYREVAPGVVNTGRQVANFLSDLKRDFGLDAEQTILVGHSLGSHVMGNAAEDYRSIEGEEIGRIIGLDPAGPLFEDDFDPLTGLVIENELDNETNRLDASDAKQVVALHTSEFFGYDDSLADLDLFINWEDLFQPNATTPVDNHSYATNLATQLFQGVSFSQAFASAQEMATILVASSDDPFELSDILEGSITGLDYVHTYAI